MGQASVEAAFVLPVLALLMAMLVQPACLLYTRCVMEGAAAQACRLMTTLSEEEAAYGDELVRAFVLRRLAAVPDAPLFHEGGAEAWTVELEGQNGRHESAVSISGSVKPLPFLGAVAALMGQGDGEGNVRLEVEVRQTVRPDWLEGSHAQWSAIW